MDKRTLIVWGRWLSVYLVVTLFFASISGRHELSVAHGVLVYLLLIIGTAREARRTLSVVMVVAGYLAVDWYFVPPVQGLGRPDKLDVFVLLGFIFTGIVISQIVASLQRTAELAKARTKAVELLGRQQLELEREAARAREAHEAEEMKNALIASIVHDLRSPITTVKMLADPVYHINPTLALRRITDEADRINQYLSTLRHFSDVGTSGKLLNVESHMVEDLLATAIASHASELQGREVIVHPVLEDDVLLVRCDLSLSLQVLGNLLQNAARYSPAHFPIDVWAEREEDNVRIVIADRGPGVLANEIDLIFEPHRQGSTALADQGQGMGLAIARTFARAQLGDVRYAPRADGGAEFVFILPLGTRITLELPTASHPDQ